MATVKPFSAIRPRPEMAAQVSELPYDVLSAEEAREMAKGNAASFYHVSKPEIDFPPDIDPYSDAVYQRARQNFDRLLRENILRQENAPAFYLYRQRVAGHEQTGVVGVCSCREYLDGVVVRHELTRPDKEEDRVRHMESLDCQTGPAFLTFRTDPTICSVISETTVQPPEIAFDAGDGVEHATWTLRAPEKCRVLEQAFQNMAKLYIADGHHRSAAAARVFEQREGAGESGFFLSVLFPHDQLRILPYNRVVRDLNGLDDATLRQRLSEVFEVERCEHVPATDRQVLGLFLGEHWYRLRFRPEMVSGKTTRDRLDVALLQDRVLAPLLGIEDARKSQRMEFVGGIRGAAALEERVRSGAGACAFLLHPTGIEDLMQIADEGGLMPPKSTWFEPKLRDGLFSHALT